MSVSHDTASAVVVDPDFWRVVPSYPGLRVSRDGQVQIAYEIRSLGKGGGKGKRIRVVTENWRPYKSYPLPSGYRYVHLSYRTAEGKYRRRILYVHKLVAAAFIGPCPAGQEVRHENGIRGDNRISRTCSTAPGRTTWTTRSATAPGRGDPDTG